jgi:nicotinic acid mononucleotide adenylyltransferase
MKIPDPQKISLEGFQMSARNLYGTTGDTDSTRGSRSEAFARTVFIGLLHKVEERAAARAVRRPDVSTIHSAMTESQKGRYNHAILKVLGLQGAKVVTPNILFTAADMALDGEVSMSEAYIGLQPGTMNPIHYGHICASLAGILVNKLDTVLLANGGTVPDKPSSADPRVRNKMLRIAASENGLSKWVKVTPIRQQVVEMFSKDRQTLILAGENVSLRRSNMDIAAFIWLFRANPKVTWTYIVGSDKVAGYGKKGEHRLIVDTLADPRANAQVLYFVREGEDIDVAKYITPYGWMLEKWKKGFFKKSPVPTCAISSSRIKAALVSGREHVDGMPLSECMSPDVLSYILNQKTLLALYAREAEEGEQNE